MIFEIAAGIVLAFLILRFGPAFFMAIIELFLSLLSNVFSARFVVTILVVYSVFIIILMPLLLFSEEQGREAALYVVFLGLGANLWLVWLMWKEYRLKRQTPTLSVQRSKFSWNDIRLKIKSMNSMEKMSMATWFLVLFFFLCSAIISWS